MRTLDGELDYFIVVFEDTTARHEAELSVVANLRKSERLNQMRGNFLTPHHRRAEKARATQVAVLAGHTCRISDSSRHGA